jgi:UDP-N-acetylglucosamine 2-epimerase
MKYVDILIGNTSSGIIEAASFHKAVVNIGDRQKGRLQSANVLNCEIAELGSCIKKALSLDCSSIDNIYGDGKSAVKIVEVLEDVSLEIKKQFVDRE